MSTNNKQPPPKRTTYDRIKRGVDVAQTAVKAYTLAKSLALLINVEKKKIDTQVSLSPYGAAPTITHLTAIAQGNGINQRAGNSIKLNYLSMKALISYATGSSGTLTSIFIIEDLQQVSDTAPAVNDIFESAAGSLGVLNLANLGRFRILYKKKITQDGMNARSIENFKKLKFHVRYNGANSTDIQKSGLYLVIMSNQVLSTAPLVQVHNRLAYIDN